MAVSEWPIIEQVDDALADLLGAPSGDIQDAFGPELAALAIKAPLNLALSRLGDHTANAVLGFALMAWAAMGKPSARSQHDAYELSAHFLGQSITFRPEDISQMLTELNALRGAVASGSAQGVRSAFVRTPEEIAGLARTVQQQVASMMGTRSVAQPRTVDTGPYRGEVPTVLSGRTIDPSPNRSSNIPTILA